MVGYSKGVSGALQRMPKLLLKLSELLRYSVYETREEFIPLQKKLQYLRNYINFEKMQNGDRLVQELAIDENPDHRVRIAPMLLIVFIENAFKYSKATRKPKMWIAITLPIKEGWIFFAIKNSFELGRSFSEFFSETFPHDALLLSIIAFWVQRPTSKGFFLSPKFLQNCVLV